MKSPIFFIAFMLSVIFVTTTYGAEKWYTDFEQVKQVAETEQKVILMDFTGSDWCGWCMKLDKEVFDTSEFNSYASKNLVLMKVDFPQGKKLSSKLKAQNEELKATYGVRGFPYIVLLDAKGTKLGELRGYKEGGAKNYISLIEAIAPSKKAEAPQQ